MLKAAFWDAIHQRLANVTLPTSPTHQNDMLDTALDAALEAHARLEPLVKVADFDGDGAVYEWSLPSDFLDSSVIQSVEYPTGIQEPTIIEPCKYTIYRDLVDGEVVRKFRMIDSTPGADETARMIYTTTYTVTDSASDLPTVRDQAVCDLGASILAAMMSAEYGRTQSSTLEADVVDNMAKIDHYIGLSRHYLYKYKESMGMKATDIVPAAHAMADFDVQMFQGKYTPLTHTTQ